MKNRIILKFVDAYFLDGEFVIELSYFTNCQSLLEVGDIMKLIWKPAFVMTEIGMLDTKNGVLGDVEITEVDVNNNVIKVVLLMDDEEFGFDYEECIKDLASLLKAYIKNDSVLLENTTQKTERNGNMKHFGEVVYIHGFEGEINVRCKFSADTPISYNTTIIHNNGQGTIKGFYGGCDDKLTVNVIFPADCTIAKGDMVEISEDVEEEVYQKTILANVNQVIHSGINKASIDMDIIQMRNRHNGLNWQSLEIKIMDRINSSVSTNIEIGLDLDHGALEEVEEFGHNLIKAVVEAREELKEEE